MAIFALLLSWAALGLLVALLALAARLKPAKWRRAGLLMLGLGTGFAGGLLGFWLFGRLFSCPTALWWAALAVCLPAAYTGLRKRLAGVV